jgi:replicative DNA helicase
MSDLRESGAIEQDADLIMFIHREDNGSGELDPSPTTVTEVIVGKHRNGGTGSVKLTFFKAYTKFENYVEDPQYF